MAGTYGKVLKGDRRAENGRKKQDTEDKVWSACPRRLGKGGPKFKKKKKVVEGMI